MANLVFFLRSKFWRNNSFHPQKGRSRSSEIWRPRRERKEKKIRSPHLTRYGSYISDFSSPPPPSSCRAHRRSREKSLESVIGVQSNRVCISELLRSAAKACFTLDDHASSWNTRSFYGRDGLVARIALDTGEIGRYRENNFFFFNFRTNWFLSSLLYSKTLVPRLSYWKDKHLSVFQVESLRGLLPQKSVV